MKNGPTAAKRVKVSHLPQNLYLPKGIESSVMCREWWIITHYSSVIDEIYGLSFWTDIIDKSPILADLWFQKTFIGHKLWLFYNIQQLRWAFLRKWTGNETYRSFEPNDYGEPVKLRRNQVMVRNYQNISHI